MTLSKAAACGLLHISSTSLCRRIKAGVYQCTRTGEGQFSALSFTYADIGLPEPQQAPEPIPAVAEVQPTPVHGAPGLEPTPSRPESRGIRTWAEKYRDGEAADSCGNKIDGTNERFITKGAQSLLGPIEIDRTLANPQAHMDPRLLSDYVDPNFTPLIKGNPNQGDGFTRSGEPLASGYSQAAYDADMQAWRQSGGGRSEGEQEIASRRAVNNINRSFPR